MVLIFHVYHNLGRIRQWVASHQHRSIRLHYVAAENFAIVKSLKQGASADKHRKEGVAISDAAVTDLDGGNSEK